MSSSASQTPSRNKSKTLLAWCLQVEPRLGDRASSVPPLLCYALRSHQLNKPGLLDRMLYFLPMAHLKWSRRRLSSIQNGSRFQETRVDSSDDSIRSLHLFVPGHEYFSATGVFFSNPCVALIMKQTRHTRTGLVPGQIARVFIQSISFSHTN